MRYPPAPTALKRLVARSGHMLDGTLLIDLTALEPGDILLFASRQKLGPAISEFQRVCGHDRGDAAFTHAAIFLAQDRIAHAIPEVVQPNLSGVRVDDLLSYWTDQPMAVLRHPGLTDLQRRDVALSAAVRHGLRYDYAAVRRAVEHVGYASSGVPQRLLDRLMTEQGANRPHEGLPTAHSCAEMVFECYGAVDPGLLPPAGLGPLDLPADLAAAEDLVVVTPQIVHLE